MTDETAALLRRTADLAVAYLETLPNRPVAGERNVAALRRQLVTPLADAGEDPASVIESWRRLVVGRRWPWRGRATSASSSAAPCPQPSPPIG
jgi:hypothetical protein